MSEIYNANPRLKAAGVPVSYTQEQIEEWILCKQDPIYFIENYVKIVTLDYGLQPMILYEYQKDIVRSLFDNSKTLAVLGRQMGKCVSNTTKYTVRNKSTGEISNVTAEEFHKMQSRNHDL